MGTLQLAAVLAAISAPGETVLLDFGASWCGPCRAIAPVVDRLAGEGFPVRKIDIDTDKALARRHRVTNIPCFVMLVDGKEVDRVVGGGGASYQRLRAMLAKARVSPPQARLDQSRFQSPASSHDGRASARRGQPTAQSSSSDSPLESRLLRASVRLKVQSRDSSDFGSGTIIDARGDEALVLTCGHLFAESAGMEKILVEVFDGQKIHTLPARLIHADPKSDVALVSFRTARRVEVVPVAPSEYKVSRGDAMINIGCNGDARPTVRSGRVLAINSFVGPANFKVSGLPVQGRSGGGLFTSDGQVVGVCSFADATDQAGGYAALAAIHALLDEVGLSDVYRARQAIERTTADAKTVADSSGQGPVPGNVEVICIIRRGDDAPGGSQVIVLERASAAFLQQLAGERTAQEQRHRTSLAVERSPWRAAPSKATSKATSKASPRRLWTPRWSPDRMTAPSQSDVVVPIR